MAPRIMQEPYIQACGLCGTEFCFVKIRLRSSIQSLGRGVSLIEFSAGHIKHGRCFRARLSRVDTTELGEFLQVELHCLKCRHSGICSAICSDLCLGPLTWTLSKGHAAAEGYNRSFTNAEPLIGLGSGISGRTSGDEVQVCGWNIGSLSRAEWHPCSVLKSRGGAIP